jgi:copper/silver efflux system protein
MLRRVPSRPVSMRPLEEDRGHTITLATVASVIVVDGPPMLRSENARLNGWIYVDIRGRDLGSYVAEAQRAVRENVTLPPGYSISWSGQFEYLERARERLTIVVPATLAIIFVLLNPGNSSWLRDISVT